MEWKVGCWHNPDLRLAAPQGPLTITFRTLATEGMRPGLKGLKGLYGPLGFAFCGRRRQALLLGSPCSPGFGCESRAEAPRASLC